MAKRSRKKKSRKKKPKKKRPQRVPTLSDDLIVEILCRVPYRSLCRFKGVSRSWLALCSDPDIRKKSPQTLSGFFCYARVHDDDEHGLRFLNISGRGRPLVDPSLPFLQGLGYDSFMFKQCCSGLVLCSCRKSSWGSFEADYVVCNPATRKWTVLPDTGEQHNAIHTLCLGFNPSMPSCFYVFLFVLNPSQYLMRVKIYSSETGAWIFRQHEWGDDSIKLNDDAGPVFCNGNLYAVTSDLSLITVDTEGTTWRKILMPHRSLLAKFLEFEAFITHSQGRLYATHIDSRNDNQLSIWQFEADGNEHWALKHTASITRLLGRHKDRYNEFYQVIAAHPELNLIFFSGGRDNELMSYDLDNQEVRRICTLEKYFQFPVLPYIPCFAEWPTHSH
ncbi:hypothetical protein EJB05_06191, partial [Eragrostis curvula]